MDRHDSGEVSLGQTEKALRALAQAGIVTAQYDLAYCLQHGLSGIEHHECEAANWYHKAALTGHALAQYRLGVLIARGRVGMANPESAGMWCGKAIEQCRGDLLTVLHTEAAGGDPDAKNTLGGAYHKGYGVKRDDGRAFELWFAAANIYCPRASWNVASSYESGIGVERDMEQAVYWYRHALRRGVGRAAHRMALLSIDGIEIPADWEAATRYLNMAIMLGWKHAEADLAALKRRMLAANEAGGDDGDGE
ncbi:MAG: sel1 repeat family protein [Spirochaetaceae bacterium]|nr:MAG: sel1 repeat family protein [Spirochaetaceae bacterium]